MFDWLIDLATGSALAYVVVPVFIAGDAVFPVLPGETLLIAGGVLAAHGELSLVLLILVGWIGSVAGDTAAYELGRHPGRRATDRLFRSEKARNRLAWARDQLDERPWLVAVARFVPGGRTAVTFSAGNLEMPLRRFLLYIVPGCLLWGTVNALLGYLGGTLFRDRFWPSLAVSLGVAALLAATAELWRRRRAGGHRESHAPHAQSPR